MRIKVGISIYQLKALIKGFYPPLYNFYFIHNQQKKIQCINGPTIQDCLDYSRCRQNMHVKRHKESHHFQNFGRVICILELQNRTFTAILYYVTAPAV